MAVSRDAAPPGPDAPTLNEPIVIAPEELSAEALRGVIESFVLREGTDYGEREHSLAEKVAQVHAQLERGQARILYDPDTNTVTLMLAPA